MGVPKFYRWISERYPCLSEVVKEFQLPEFDNLYLDMNGIIHVCSHPDDENPHFRITEEKIFKDICHYIDFLFRMIKPRKVFFMAVDGVAPRAKMNQQRGRRFRSAREAEVLIKKAEERGEVLPTEKRFDSNCITPGTSFMVRLQEHLKYFVVDKISHDPQWQGPKVYLSGHETPGEGEHKVMDYIRYAKSQADYDPDTRHCLYGLDADLIMLGLTSHDPHFSLLREEVRFGGRRDKNKRPATPEETTFHLLHLSLMRDYLAYEFSDIKDKLPFPWDLEKIIDDWILMGFLVGNDFIPHLPHLHIHQDALPLLWKTYKNVLPTLDGYINESGHLNLRRFEKYFEELSKFDVETFESAFSDLRFLESKLGGKTINESLSDSRPKDRLKKLEKFKVEKNGVPFRALEEGRANNIVDCDESDADSDDTVEFGDDDGDDDEDDDEDDYDTTRDEFNLHKRDYYMNKMNYPEVSSEVLREQAHGYVLAIQWILLYYFEGCSSWSWFYPHHYAPYISDVRGFSDMKITFELSKPFLPFQQLMAVLPAASKDFLPAAYQLLMTEPDSPIVDFYPVNFESDLNGKQQDWEAVVLIPFIEERRLLEAMASKEHLLTAEEQSRNYHGPHFMYYYTPENMGSYPSSLPGVFPDVHINKAKIVELHKDLFRIDANRLRRGLLSTVRLDVYFPGFPTLRFLPHTHELVKVGVKVFQHPSRGDNMVLRVQSTAGLRLEEVADSLLGKITYVGWPHIHEARVVAVANESFRIELIEEEGKKSNRGTAASFSRRKLDQSECAIVAREANDIKERLMNRFAIDVGQSEIIVYACPMTGRTYAYGVHGTLTLEKQFAADRTSFLHQMTIQDLQVEESGHTTFRTLEEVFPTDSTVFMVGNPHYGAQGKVLEVLPEEVRVRIALHVKEEPDFRKIEQSGLRGKYLNSYQAAQQIGIDSHIMSRITGSVFVEKSGGSNNRVNIGLNLKFTKKGEEVPGYTRKEENGWCYSYKCVKAVEDYITRFPDLWLVVQRQNSSTDNFMEEALFPESGKTKLADVVTYLEELPCSKVPRMKTGSEILDEEHVELIEKMTAALNPKPDIVKVKVKPKLLFRPLPNQGSLVPDPGTDFRLYDRVVVVKSGYSVPFGRRGTITGIPSEEDGGITPSSLYDVVFDEAFAGGITLRCCPGKGYRVPGSAMLNLTYGEFRKGQPGARGAGRAVPNSAYHANGSGHFGAGHNNSNIAGARPSYNDRVGPYMQGDRASLWQQQQQQQQQFPQQFQQQPVKWDKGQPIFGHQVGQNQYGQSFGRGGGTAQPKFVTPKVQGPAAGITSRSVNQVQQRTFAPENRDTENSEFNNMWRNLLTHQNATQVTKTPEPAATAAALSSQSPNPNQNLAQGQSTSAAPQSNLQQQLLQMSQSASSRPLELHFTSANQQEQALRGQLEPQLGGLLPKRVLSQPTASGSHQETSKGVEGMKSVVQNLFQSAANSQALSAGGESAEFLALFNSLQLQQHEEVAQGAGGGVLDKAARASSAVPASSDVKSQADVALRQLLKIGVESPAGASLTSASPTATSAAATLLMGAVQVSHIEETRDHSDGGTGSQTGRSPVPAYGRQLSLQELFEEANKHQQKQGVAMQQQQQQTLSSAARSNENRDTLMELEAYCKNTLNIGPPQYDYKLQPKQNAYIANVILPNGQRYEGSQCRTKEEAAKSAAGMAILCLNARPNTHHPLTVGYQPGAQRSHANRFFSANSAFSPIGVTGPAPLQRPPVSAPLLLTPQHFINQPPPPLSLHQLLQQYSQQSMGQQSMGQQSMGQQSMGQHGLNYRPELTQRQHQQSDCPVLPPHAVPVSAGQLPATATSSSVIQQFIPLQVSRNQKTPSRRKDSESERSDGGLSSGSDTKHHHLDDFVTQLPSAESAMSTREPDQHPAVPKDKKDKNGVVFQSSSSVQSGTLSSSSSGVSSKAATPSRKSGRDYQKKKTRLAANFGTKRS